MTNKINFTKKAIEDLPTPEIGQRTYYKDTKVRGLEVMVTHSGAKSFKVYRKFKGRPVRVTLGKFPDLTVEKARKKAEAVNSDFADGVNCIVEKKKISNECTFKELFDKYIDEYAKPNGNRSWEDDVKDVNRNLKHWMNRKISSITKDEVSKLHVKFGKDRGIHGANRLLDRINAIYNKAIQEWNWDGVNPAKGITKFRMKSRDRFIQPEEFPCFFQALSEEESTIARDYIIISLLTGARKGNVLAMRWEQVSFEREVWRIPETKNGEPLSIPLANEALELLKRLHETSTSEWVFPGTGSTGHLQDPKKAWKRICRSATINLWERSPKYSGLVAEAKKSLTGNTNELRLFDKITELADKHEVALPSGLMDVRIHDLRRTLGSWQAAAGTTTAIIGKSLGHKSFKSTAIYERLNIDPVKQASLQQCNPSYFLYLIRHSQLLDMFCY